MTEEIDIAMHEYDKWYNQRKNEVCDKLLTIRNYCPIDRYCDWLLDAINFIQEEKR